MGITRYLAQNKELSPLDREENAPDLNRILPRKRVGLFGLCAIGLVGIILAGLAGAAFFVWNLQREGNSAFLREQLLAGLAGALGSGHQISLEGAALTLSGVNPVFAVRGLSIRNEDSGISASLAQADLALRSSALWRLTPEPTHVGFEGLRIVLPDTGSQGAFRPVEIFGGMLEALRVLKEALIQPGAASHLAQIEGRGISILLRDAQGMETLLRDRITFDIQRVDTGMEVSLTHPDAKKPLVLRLTQAKSADNTGALEVESASLPIGALGEMLGLGFAGVDPALALRTSLRFRVLASGAPGEIEMSASFNEGVIRLPDPDIPPFRLDLAALTLQFKPGARQIGIPELALRIGDVNIRASGVALPTADGGLQVSLKADRPAFDRLSDGESVVMLDRLEIDARIAPDFRSVDLERVEFADGAGIGRGKSRLSLENGGLIETEFSAEGFDLRRALRLWPIGSAPAARRWMVAHAHGGSVTQLKIRSSLAGNVLQDAFKKRPLPDEALLLEVEIAQAEVKPILDGPPIRQGVFEARVSGRKALITLKSGQLEALSGKPLLIRNATFRIDDTSAKPATLDMNIPFSGRIDAFLAMLATPTLKAFVTPPGDIVIQDGIIDGTSRIALRLLANPAPKDMTGETRAELRNVVIDHISKGEKLESGVFQLSQNGAQTSIKGNARLSGLPAQIEVKGEAGKSTLITINSVLDEAARARRGADLRPVLTGPVGLVATITLEKGASPDIDVELDLAKAKVEGIIPGFVKRVGQPGRVSFGYEPGADKTVLSDFALDLGSVNAMGTLELGKDGQFLKADLSTFKLSTGDNARALIEKGRGGLKISLRGNSFDLRPFLRSFQSGRIDDAKSVDLELDLNTTVLIGFQNELISGVEVKALRRAGQLTRLGVKGRFGGAPLNIETVRQQADGVALQIDTSDAGALLRFMDIYPRMFGGRMTSEIIVGKEGQKGLVQVRDFVVRGEPLLRQYAGSAQVSGSRPGSTGEGSQGQRVGSEAIQFTKLRADFNRRPGSLELNEAVMWGNEIGGTLEGKLDYAGDKVDLKGTLVPAYALNNLFSQLPLLGPIFGGSQYEGLFALPFVISGKASAPVLRSNALSVVAPGFLRKIFEFQREGGARPGQLQQSNPR